MRFDRRTDQQSFISFHHYNEEDVNNRLTSSSLLTRKRIISNSIFIEPLATRDRKPTDDRSIAWEDRTGTVSWRQIDLEIQRARTVLRGKLINNFKSPEFSRRIAEEEIFARSEIRRVSS